jgi:hypothetical protein
MLTREDLIESITRQQEQVDYYKSQKLDSSGAVFALESLKVGLYALAVRTHLIQALDIEIKTRPKSQLARAYENFKMEIKG